MKNSPNDTITDWWDTVITEKELADAIIAGDRGTARKEAHRIFTHTLNCRRGSRNPQVDGEEAITSDELEAAMRRRGWDSTWDASIVFNDAIAHRAVENFKPGAIVTSDSNFVYIRTEDGRWMRLTSDGRRIVDDEHLARPLTQIGVTV